MPALDSKYADWKHWDAADFGRYSRAEARYFEVETGLVAEQPARVLEIGFGNGNFLGWARSLGAEVYGIEIDPVLAERASALIGADHVLSSLDDPRGQELRACLTHIVAFDVIEHLSVETMRAWLGRVKGMLAPDGLLLLRFPNGDSPFGRFNQHGDPTHVTTWGAQKLLFVAREAGFEAQDVRAPALPITGVGVVSGVKRLLIRLARGLIERVMAPLYFYGCRIPLDPNYLVVLRHGRDDPAGAAPLPVSAALTSA